MKYPHLTRIISQLDPSPKVLTDWKNDPEKIRDFLIRTVSECSKDYLLEFFKVDLGLNGDYESAAFDEESEFDGE